MTVYVTQEPKPNRRNWIPDLSPAKEYGAIEFVFSANERVCGDLVQSMAIAKKQLANFAYYRDHVLWPNSGDPASFATIIMALVSLGQDEITFLQWNRHFSDNGIPIRNSGYYQPMTISINPPNQS